MSDHEWVKLATCDQVPLREGRVVMIDGLEVALFNLGDRFLATENRCPHRAGPLCDGIVTGDAVVCPLHSWKINLSTGCVERPGEVGDRSVTTYPVRIEQGVLIVKVPIT